MLCIELTPNTTPLYNVRRKTITIPKHEPIKKVYIELVKEIVESEVRENEDN